MKLQAFILLSTLLCASFGHAANLGDPAPPISITQWIKGQPLRFDPGTNIYVLECWATWCGPCKKSIPHLTALQAKYGSKGVVLVGISDEPTGTVAPFVASQGTAMNYHVAVDSSGRTLAAYTGAFGKNGIPVAYVIKEGRVLWHGSPMGGLDEALEKIVAGTYDLASERDLDVGDRFVKQYTSMVSKTTDITKAAALGEKILSDHSQNWRVPYRLSKAILTDPDVRKRDLELAMKAASKATELSGRRSFQSLEMLARAQFATGKKEEAIQTQKEALTLCKDADDRAELEKFLKLFEKSVK